MGFAINKSSEKEMKRTFSFAVDRGLLCCGLWPDGVLQTSLDDLHAWQPVWSHVNQILRGKPEVGFWMASCLAASPFYVEYDRCPTNRIRMNSMLEYHKIHHNILCTEYMCMWDLHHFHWLSMFVFGLLKLKANLLLVLRSVATGQPGCTGECYRALHLVKQNRQPMALLADPCFPGMIKSSS